MNLATVAVLSTTVFMFIVTIVQVLIYVQSRKRERIIEYKKIHQELIFPYLNEVLLYIEMQTDCRKEYGVELIHIQQDHLITKIYEKVSYGDGKLLNAFIRYFKSISYFEEHGEAKQLATYEVLFYYLHYTYDSLANSRYDNEELLDNIQLNEKIVGIAFVLTSVIGKEEAMKILSHKWLWSPNFLKKLSTELLEDLMCNYNSSKMEKQKLLTFLSTIKAGFFESTEADHFVELKEYIEEAMMTVKQRWVNYTY